MAITNVGYDGTVSDVEFAQLSQHTGALVPVVCGFNDFAVSVNTGGTLTCNVAAGSAEAPGVLTKSDATASVVFDSVTTTGQTRWDAVVLRRNWSTGTSTLVVVKGTASAAAPQVLPSGVDLTLDSAVDQVLALVQITNGLTLPTKVVDYRLQGSKVFTAPAPSALPPASLALYGMEAAVGNERYRCLTDSGGSAAWVGVGTSYSGRTVASSPLTCSTAAVTVPGMSLSVPVKGPADVYMVQAHFDVQLSASTAGLFVGTLTVGGTPQSSQAIWGPGSNAATGARSMSSQSWRVTGLTAGSVAFACQGRGTAANAFLVNSSHSALTVTQVV